MFNFARSAIKAVGNTLGGASHAPAAAGAGSGADPGDPGAIVVTGSRYQPLTLQPISIDSYLDEMRQRNWRAEEPYILQQLAQSQAARDQVNLVRDKVAAASPAQHAKLRAQLVFGGKVKPKGQSDPEVRGAPGIAGGTTDSSVNWSGWINDEAYFQNGDLGTFLTQPQDNGLRPYVEDTPESISANGQTIFNDTNKNWLMLHANIVALRGTGNPILGKLADDLANRESAYWQSDEGQHIRSEQTKVDIAAGLGLGIMFAPVTILAAADTAPGWVPGLVRLGGYEGSTGTILGSLTAKAGIGLTIELSGNYVTNTQTTAGGITGTVLASTLIAPGATKAFGLTAKGWTIAGGLSGLGSNGVGQLIDRPLSQFDGTELLLSTGLGAFGGRLAAPLQGQFGATSLLFSKYSPLIEEAFFAPVTASGAGSDVVKKVIVNKIDGK